MYLIEDFLIASPLILIVIFVVAAFALQNYSYAMVALAVFLCGMLLNMYIKFMFFGVSHLWPNFKIQRPSDCPNENVNGCEKCSILRNHKKEKLGELELLGLPSGHAQSMALALVLAVTLAESVEHKIMIGIVLALWLCAVCYQRVTSECHSIFQVGLGSVIGIALGFLIKWFFFEKI